MIERKDFDFSFILVALKKAGGIFICSLHGRSMLWVAPLRPFFNRTD